MNSLTEALVTIGVAIVGLATLAVIVSQRSNTANVLGAAGKAFSSSIGAAVSPVTGGGSALPTMPSFGGYTGY